ncbi:MAG: efflux RND transporter periplasmic adaptor subunit [Verrucomicrobia bacterium]|nr:efflux RND transporter periplasmic adaptor subunit [Verrucomicrobiota bacterium]
MTLRFAILRFMIPVLGCTVLLGCGPRSSPASGGPPSGFSVQVVAIPAREEPVIESVRLIGSIAPNESVEIKAETDGVLDQIAFSEGQPVAKGELLASLDDTKFRASLVQAEASLRLARSNFERARQMLDEKLIPQRDFDQASAMMAEQEANTALMQRNLKDTRILAPFSGIAGARQVSPGQVITRSTLLGSLVDLKEVKVELQAPERYLGQLQPGQRIQFSVAAFPDLSFDAEVYFISPQLDPNTRTALIKARASNSDLKLKGGMFASLDLRLQLRQSALVIPEPALMNNGDSVFVFVVGSDGKAAMRPVQVGLRLAGKAEILKGLAPGDQVIVEGVQKLGPGVPVKLAPAEASAPYQKS